MNKEFKKPPKDACKDFSLQSFIDSSRDTFAPIEVLVKEGVMERSSERRERYKDSLSTETVLDPSRLGPIALIAVVLGQVLGFSGLLSKQDVVTTTKSSSGTTKRS